MLLEFFTGEFIANKMQYLCRMAYYKTVPRSVPFGVTPPQLPEREGGYFFNIGLKMNWKTHIFISDKPYILEGKSGILCGEFLRYNGYGEKCEVPDGWCRFISSEIENGVKMTLIVLGLFENGIFVEGPSLRY